MNPLDVIDLSREALLQAGILCAPLLGAALLAGLLMGMLQTVTQVQDQAVSNVPRILAVIVVLALCLPWMVDRAMDYSQSLYHDIPRTVSGD